MQKLHFSIKINAPKEKVWQTTIGKDTYPLWTEVFSPNSNFDGSWEKGSKILFSTPNEDGKRDGMVSEIAENRPNEFISIKHIGYMKDDVEDTTSERVKNGRQLMKITHLKKSKAEQNLLWIWMGRTTMSIFSMKSGQKH